MKPLRNPAQERTLRRRNAVSIKRSSHRLVCYRTTRRTAKDDRATGKLPGERKESDGRERAGECNTPEPDFYGKNERKKVSSGECNTPEPDSAERTNGKR